MVKLYNSGIIDVDTYSEERIKRVSNTNRVLGIEDNSIILLNNGQDTIKVEDKRLIFNSKRIDVSSSSEDSKIKCFCKYYDFNRFVGGRVNIDTPSCWVEAETDRLSINSNVFLGYVLSDYSVINIHNDSDVGIYSFVFHSDEHPMSIYSTIRYNGETIVDARNKGPFMSGLAIHIVYLKDIIGIKDAVTKDNEKEIIEKMEKCDYLTKGHTRALEYTAETGIRIQYSSVLCKLIVMDRTSFIVDLDKICGCNILNYSSW